MVATLENQAQNPGFVFSESVEQVNTSNHYRREVADSLADVQQLDLEAMRASTASVSPTPRDFTYFIVGAFSVDDDHAARSSGGSATLPSTGQEDVDVPRHGRALPGGGRHRGSAKGREPRGQTVMSFFADTELDELEMHRARAAASLLGIRLRDILREELGGTYGVSVTYDNSLPLRGYGARRCSSAATPRTSRS